MMSVKLDPEWATQSILMPGGHHLKMTICWSPQGAGPSLFGPMGSDRIVVSSRGALLLPHEHAILVIHARMPERVEPAPTRTGEGG